MLLSKLLSWGLKMLLANIYAASGNRHLCEDVEQQRKERGVKRQPGHTWIEVDNKVNTFVVDDQDHPQMVEICAELKSLSGLMHDALGMCHIPQLCYMM